MMSPGNYYVGDLCYVMHDEWDEVCSLTISGNKCLEGVFCLSNGKKFAMFGTAWGDGEYYDDFGRSYSVDSGTIGCILVDDIDKDNAFNSIDGGQVIEFNQAFAPYEEDGTIVFDRVRIHTDPEQDYTDEE